MMVFAKSASAQAKNTELQKWTSVTSGHFQKDCLKFHDQSL